MDDVNILSYEFNVLDEGNSPPVIKLLDENEKRVKTIEIYSPIKQNLCLYMENKESYTVEKLKCMEHLYALRPPPYEPLSSRIANIYERLRSYHCKDANHNKDNITYLNRNKQTLKLDYPCLLSITEVIFAILNTIINKKNFSEIVEISMFKKKTFGFLSKSDTLWNRPLISIITELNRVKEIHFCISSNKHDKEILCEEMFLFSQFYSLLFKTVTMITVNLNVNKINSVFIDDKNPYKITKDSILKFQKSCNNVILSNYILTSLIEQYSRLESLTVILDDSYIYELDSILGMEIGVEWNEFALNGQIYITKLMSIENNHSINLKINSLDPLLFKSINGMIVNNDRNLDSITLELFPKRNAFSLRKILFNYNCLYQNKEINKNIEHEFAEEDKMIEWNYTRELKHASKLLIKEERIPKYLYNEFSANLSDLQIILSNGAQFLKTLDIDISPYKLLTQFDYYNSLITVFIVNILEIVSHTKEMQVFALKANTLEPNYECLINNVKRIKKEIPNLNNTSIRKLHLDIPNISNMIPFNNFPKNTLEHLFLHSLCEKDFKLFQEHLMSCHKEYKCIERLEITLDYLLNDITDTLNSFFKLSIPRTLKTLVIRTKNQIALSDLQSNIMTLYNQMNVMKYNLKVSYTGSINEFERVKGNVRFASNVKTMLFNEIKKQKMRSSCKVISNDEFEVCLLKYPKWNAKVHPYIIKGFEGRMNKKKKSTIKNLYTNQNKMKIYSNIFLFLAAKKTSIQIKVN